MKKQFSLTFITLFLLMSQIVYSQNGENKLDPLTGDAEAGDRLGYSVSISDYHFITGAYGNDDNGHNSGTAYLFHQGGDLVKKITASDGAADDYFGYAVSISIGHAIVGAYGDDDKGFESGSAYIFSSSGNWTQQAKLTAGDGAVDDQFGYSVSINLDDAIVGAWSDDDKGSESGSAYIFNRNQSGDDYWGEVKKLTAGDGDTDNYFGRSVFISGDYAIVGADGVSGNTGAAYIFNRNQGGTDNWGQVARLTASDGLGGDFFGYSVSLSGDYAVVGAYGQDDFGFESGAAYIYYRNQGGTDNWGQVTKLTGDEDTGYAYFGYSVSISADNALISAYRENTHTGAVYIFNRNQDGIDNWGRVKKITVSEGEIDDEFGYSVSIWEDYALIGAHGDDDNGSWSGSGYCFYKDQDGVNNWGKQFKISASSSDLFGSSVSLNDNDALVGANNDDDKGENSGSAYIFYRYLGGEDQWGQAAKLTASDGAASDQFGISVAISGDYALVGASEDDNTVGSAYIFSRDQGGVDNWGEVKKLTATDRAWMDHFGHSVSLSGDYALVGAYGDDDKGEMSGSAYIFNRNLGGTDNWGQLTKLTASDGFEYDFFGYSVSLSGDYALVGAYGKGDPGFDAGSAYIFYRNQGGADNWGQVKKLNLGEEAANDLFGHSVSISVDYALIGAYGNDTEGSAYVFYRNQGGADNWGQQSKLVASDGAADDYFGYSVSLSDDYAIIGANADDDKGEYSGSSYIFYRNQGGTNTWDQLKKITASDGLSNDNFGYSVSISGVHALVGAHSDDDFAANFGSAFIYKNENIFVRSPNGGEIWKQGSNHLITWESNLPNNVTINLYKGDIYNRTIALATSNDGSLIWPILDDLPDGSDYSIRILDWDDGDPYDESDGFFTLDGTAPGTPTNIVETNGAESDIWQHHINHPSFTWTPPSDLSGIEKYYLYFGSNPAAETPIDSTDNTSFNISAPEGISFFRIQSKDNAGNTGNWTTVFVFKYDATAPLNPTTVTEQGGSLTNTWQSSVSNPNFTWSGASDPLSGISLYLVYWGPDINGSPSPESSSPSFDPGPELNGTFYLRVSVEDAVGNRSPDTTLFIFKHDGTPPINPTDFTDLVGSDNDIWQNTVNDPNFSWNTGSDPLSGILGYKFYWGVLPNGISTDLVYSSGFNPAAVDTGTWFLRISTIDHVLNSAPWFTGYIFRYDNILPHAKAASDDTSGYLSFNVNWFDAVDKGGSGLAIYDVMVRDGEESWRSWLTGTSVTNEFYTGEQGHTYYFEAAATDKAGNMEEFTGTVETHTSIDTLTTDVLPPEPPIALTAGGSNPSPWQNRSQFELNWTDPEDPSKITLVYYKLDTAPTSKYDYTGVIPVTPPRFISATKEGGQYLFLWLKDGRGNVNYQNYSTVELRYDGTAPINTMAFVAADTSVSSTFLVSWSGASDIGGSGLSGYYNVQVRTDGGAWKSWKDSTSLMDAEYTGIQGHTYYFEAAARDNAGNIEEFSGEAECLTYLAPKLSIAVSPLEGEQSDNIEFHFSISNYDNSATDIKCEYSLSSDKSWNLATVIGNARGLLPEDYKGTITWDSYTDAPGVDIATARFKITPYDFNSSGLPDSTLVFHVDNNWIPSVIVDSIETEQSDDILISYHLFDLEADTLLIICEYYHSSNQSWLAANTTGNLSDITDYNGFITWNSAENIPLALDTYQFRIRPYDNDQGISDTVLILIDNVGAPNILFMSDITEEKSGDITINYLLSDLEYDIINLICEYSDDSGNSWSLASVSGAVTNIPPSSYAGSLTWKSSLDLPGIDKTTVRFRITPSDANIGTFKETSDFHLDNNLLPTLQIHSLQPPQSCTVKIPITIQDIEKDTVNISGKYQIGGSGWNKLQFTNTPQFAFTEYTDTLYWKSLDELGFGEFQAIQIQLVPMDNDTGTYVLSNVFDVYNYAGDYSGDLLINSDDLIDFSLAWKNQDLNLEIGPAAGKPPVLIPQPDGKIDFEDLMVLVQQWNWSYDTRDYILTKSLLPADFKNSTVHIITKTKVNGKTEILWNKVISLPEPIPEIPASPSKLVSMQQSNYDRWANEFGDALVLNIDTTASLLALQMEMHYAPEIFSFKEISNVLLSEQNGFTFKSDDKENGWIIINTIVLEANKRPLEIQGELIRFNIDVLENSHTPLYYNWKIYNEIGVVISTGESKLDLEIHLLKPQEYSLYQNFPNPFNPSTTIRYQLPEDGKVQLDIFNILGECVCTLVNKSQKTGYYSQIWDISKSDQGIASGIYFVRLYVSGGDGGRYINHKKIIVLK
jgi:hypothetical protein